MPYVLLNITAKVGHTTGKHGKTLIITPYYEIAEELTTYSTVQLLL